MIGIISGTGLAQLDNLNVTGNEWLETPWGDTSSALCFGKIDDAELVFLSRHGDPHQIPPHLINYRANLSALKQVGVTQVIAVNSVGGIHAQLGPAKIAIPDQIIDYTYGREQTIFDGDSSLEHIDFTHPYNESLRQALISAAQQSDIDSLNHGVYGVTQGPRLETAAEIKKYQKEGCDMIGMTGMPEAALAREFGLDYVCLALSVNWCAGLSDSVITMTDIHQAIAQGTEKVQAIINSFLKTV